MAPASPDSLAVVGSLAAEFDTACNLTGSVGSFHNLGYVAAGCSSSVLVGDYNSLVVVELSLRFSRSYC